MGFCWVNPSSSCNLGLGTVETMSRPWGYGAMEEAMEV